MIRRTAATEAVPALSRAVRLHADQFVRYRALVLLSAFNDPGTGAIMRGLLADRNDRVREVAYRWFERHPEPALHATLLAALNTEQAEFVRPALVRALAAHADTPAVQRALIAEAGRGLDFFRSAVIDALGEQRATYAVDAIIPIVSLDGPLQDDAMLALGRIGDRAAMPALASLTKVPPEAAPSLQAAQCLLGDKCEERIAWLARGGADRDAPGRVESRGRCPRRPCRRGAIPSRRCALWPRTHDRPAERRRRGRVVDDGAAPAAGDDCVAREDAG